MSGERPRQHRSSAAPYIPVMRRVLSLLGICLLVALVLQPGGAERRASCHAHAAAHAAPAHHPAAPERDTDCPHCPAADCTTVSSCAPGPGVLLADHPATPPSAASAPLPAAGATRLVSRSPQPGYPPPRLA
jgi:hypothetical protein